MNNDHKNAQAQRLGSSSIGKLLVSFSVPAIIGMLVQSLYNIVDRIFIGQGVGALGLAGATVGFPIMLVSMAFGMLVGIGGNAIVSISLGEKRPEYAEKVLGNAFTLLLIISLALTILGLIFIEPILRISGASDEVLPYAVAYMTPILAFSVFNGIAFGMNNFIRGEGNPKMAMITMLIGAIMNTILDPIFIFGFGWGIEGAAWATVISQVASSLWVMWYYLAGKSLLKLRPANLKLDPAILKRIIAIGLAPFAMQLAASGVNILLNFRLQNYGGDLAISAMGIVYSISMVFMMPLFGLNQGSQPIIGYNYGARQYSRVVKTIETTIIVATIVVTLGWAATRLFPEALIMVFSGNDTELIEVARVALNYAFLLFPVLGFQVVASGYFMSMGMSRQAMFLSLSRQVIFLIPSLLILPNFFGLAGVYGSMPAADFLSSIVTAILFFSAIRKMKKQKDGADIAGPRVEIHSQAEFEAPEEPESLEPEQAPLASS